ncbi:MAG: hypothetical protein ACR5LF_11650 [Symbiopectobacterium sp.]
MDYERVWHEMMIIVGKILASEPNNVIALFLQWLLLCAENNKEAASKFHFAMLLAPHGCRGLLLLCLPFGATR